MSDVKKKVIATITLLLLGAAVLATIWLAVLAWRGSFVDDPSRDQPRLHESWFYTLWFMKQGAALKVIFAAVIALVSAGMVEASNFVKRGVHLFLLCAVCFAGIIACICILAKLDNPEALATLRWFSGFESDAQILSAANWLFYALIGWFGGFILVLLGVRHVFPNPLRGGNAAPPPAGS